MELDVRVIVEKLLEEMIKESDANYHRMEGVKLLYTRLVDEARRIEGEQPPTEGDIVHE